MSLIFATWVSAAATMLLAVGAGLTVYYARRAFVEQSRQMQLLQQQTRDLQALAEQHAKATAFQAKALTLGQESDKRLQEAEARKRRNQANHVLFGLDRDHDFFIQNQSKSPISHVEIRWMRGEKIMKKIEVNDISPGCDEYVHSWSFNHRRWAPRKAALFFRDADGANWARRLNGTPKERA